MSNYEMTRAQRENALAALKETAPKIWNGEGRYCFTGRFICIALDINQRDGGTVAIDAIRLIQRSLGGGYATYETWMKANGFKGVNFMSYRTLQAHRKRWVQHLIESLQNSLKDETA